MTDTTDKRTRQDFEDQQNEIAGRDTGRMARFGVGTSRAQNLKEQEKKERAFRDALDQLLAAPEYRALYLELGNRLATAETEADTAIAMIQEQLRLTKLTIELMDSDAARDPDGKSVFRFADGRVVYADGSDVPSEIAEGIIWPEDAPSAEDYFAAKNRSNALQARLDEWRNYRNDTLGGIRDRYDDRKNPYENKGDLQTELDRIDEMRPELAEIAAPTEDVIIAPEASLAALDIPMKLN